MSMMVYGKLMSIQAKVSYCYPYSRFLNVNRLHNSQEENIL